MCCFVIFSGGVSTECAMKSDLLPSLEKKNILWGGGGGKELNLTVNANRRQELINVFGSCGGVADWSPMPRTVTLSFHV